MQKTEYIAFTIKDEKRFNDLLKVYRLIADSRANHSPRPDQFWLEAFPDYALKHYAFAENDLKPAFETAHDDGQTWHFYALTEHLTENLDVTFLECLRTEKGKGTLNFFANGYPYGGITGLIMFLNAFECKACQVDEEGGIYNVDWVTGTRFELKATEPNNTVSSDKF